MFWTENRGGKNPGFLGPAPDWSVMVRRDQIATGRKGSGWPDILGFCAPKKSLFFLTSWCSATIIPLYRMVQMIFLAEIQNSKNSHFMGLAGGVRRVKKGPKNHVFRAFSGRKPVRSGQNAGKI
jgi:hypothetical protein